MASFKSTAVTATITIALTIWPQVVAWPKLYNDFGLCEIPSKGYEGHMPPTENPAITFDLADASGAAVTEWAAGEAYTLTVGPYDTAKPTSAWIHAAVGTLAPVNATAHSAADACPAAVFSSELVMGAHVVTWTAPADDSLCVTVSTAQATGPTAGYDVGLVALPGASAKPCDLPTLIVSNEPPHEEGAAAEGEAVEGAAVEGEAVEGSGSVGAAARAAACVIAAAAVTAALAAV